MTSEDRIAALEARVAELERELQNSDDIRAALHAGVRDVSQDVSTAITTIQAMDPVVQAARAWAASYGINNVPLGVFLERCVDLRNQVSAYEKVTARRS